MTKTQTKFLFAFIFIGWALFNLPPSYAVSTEKKPIAGINFPGPGIAGHVYPGKLNKNYHFPSEADIKTYADFGFELIRLAVTWERLQPELGKPFDAAYLKQIDKVIQTAEKQQVKVVLDIHNYGKYKGELIGTKAVPVAAFASLWSELATHYRQQDNLIFGLMNEPHKQEAKEWSEIAQAGISAIRDAKAPQKIFVPATYYSSAARWLKKHGSHSNGEALKTVNDPNNNLVFEAHQYLDRDSSGTNAECVSADIGVKRLTEFTNWLKANQFEGFLGEFGASDSETCQQALENTLAHIRDNQTVWYGWSYWVADPWFKNYMFNIYPPDSEQFPQARILKQFIEAK